MICHLPAGVVRRSYVSAAMRMAQALLGVSLLCGTAFARDDAPTPDQAPPGPPPTVKGLEVLFSGKPEELAQKWVQGKGPAHWKLEDGVMVSTGSDIATKERYTDFQLHVEFRIPYMPDKKGQARGNSGVFLQGRYEIQVLDSYGISEPGTGDCGAVYTEDAPLVNACKPPLQWQTYDISFRAPRYDSADHTKLLEPGRVTVFQNGIVIQNAAVITGLTHHPAKPKSKPKTTTVSTPGAVPATVAQSDNMTGTKAGTETTAPPEEDLSQPGPIRLQYHGCPVAFRNIWIVPLPLQGAKHYESR